MIYSEYKTILTLAKKYCENKKEMTSFLEHSGIGVSLNIEQISQYSVEEFYYLLEKIIKRNDGIIEKIKEDSEHNDADYRIYYEQLGLEIILWAKEKFMFKIKLDDVNYFLGYEQDYCTFLSILCYPSNINEFNFPYRLLVNGENNRFLNKNDALTIFIEKTKELVHEGNIKRYRLDKYKVYGFFENNTHSIVLENLFEIEETKFKKTKNIMDLVISLDLEDMESYNKLGFNFYLTEQKELIQILNLIAEKYDYIVNRLNSTQLTISQKNKVSLTIKQANHFNTKNTPFLEIPFQLNIEISNNGRIGTLHPSFLKKRLGEAKYENNIYSLEEILKIIEDAKNQLTENSYVVLFGGQSEELPKTMVYYDTFEDALYSHNGFLDIIKNFNIVDLDISKKFGVAYSSIEQNGTPTSYCTITKSDKIAEFYANIIRMHNL